MRHFSSLAIIALLTLGCQAATPPAPTASVADGNWTGTWATAVLTVGPNAVPNPGLANNTLRQLVQTSIAGSALRVRLTNLFGNSPMTITNARIAKSAGAGAVVSGTDHALTFGGQASVTIPAGGEVVSDAIAWELPPMADLAVSIAFGDATSLPTPMTGHPGRWMTSYLAVGNRTRDDTLTEAVPVAGWFGLAGIEVVPTKAPAVLVTLGNSITDGYGATPNGNDRWPDVLARRLQADSASAHIAVLNAGISGNRLLMDRAGQSALNRLDRDVLNQPNVRWVIVLLGINDIAGTASDSAAARMAADLIAGYREIIQRAHAKGIKVFGGTILAAGGSGHGTPPRDAARAVVNEWIRSSGAFDAVVDFDAMTRDPDAQNRMLPLYDSGDHLHPGPAGYAAMGNGINLALFRDELRVARIFQDGVVLQRDVPHRVWGWATAGTHVRITLGDRTASATANANGEWQASVPALAAGGPYELTVTDGSARIAVRDILVGDVWVAAGQSNMDWSVGRSDSARAVIAAANDPWIRNFKVNTAVADAPLHDVRTGEWKPATSANVGSFSGIAYFFARDLRPELQVPIGIVDVSWPGANIETFMTPTAQDLSDAQYAERLAVNQVNSVRMRQALLQKVRTATARDSGIVANAAGVPRWADPTYDDAAWDTIPVPGAWENAGYPAMNGIAWYRTTFTWPTNRPVPAAGATLHLGAVDDGDEVWVNGIKVGQMSAYGIARVYPIPATALRAGANVIAVRVTDGGGNGGICCTGIRPRVEYAASGGSGGATRADTLAPRWKFRASVLSFAPDGQSLNKIPAIAWNAMVEPLTMFPVRGVLWYQGESNANNVAQSAAYRTLKQNWIRQWRAEWHAQSGSDSLLPVLWVSLANFGAPDTAPPTRSTWGLVRESQHAALALPNTGEVMAIDVGNPWDIHPTDKQTVGRRLAGVARAVSYGTAPRSAVFGPTYVSHEVRDDCVIVTLENVGTGLVARDPAKRIGGFAIAGEDRRWEWAEVSIEGNRVTLRSDKVRQPVAVRYAWANSPTGLNLYSSYGLPAVPFRTDAW